MRNRVDSVTDAYRCLLSGSCPSQSAGDLASVILAGVCGLPPVQERGSGRLCQREESSDSGCYREDITELTYITLTLVGKINSSLLSQRVSPEASSYFMEIQRVLFQEEEFMAKLVHQFQAEDQLISHLAAKSASTYIFYELQESGTINPVWHQKCVQVFCNSFPSTELDACIWLFTDVLKKLLKGSHEETLGRLLAVFDLDLCALCSKFLPKESEEVRRSAVDFANIGHWPTSFCSLLNLLEVLTASRLICHTGVCLQSQRLTHTHASALLRIVVSSAEYFVKKRVLLLLKKTQLQTAGEDMALGEVAAGGLRDEHFSADMTTLADSVLQAVSADWLRCVQVEATASFFGGSSQVRGDGGQKPDYVMLRAVGLVVLKSLELNVKSAGGTDVDRAEKVHGYLQALAGFLRQRGVPVKEASHRCRWFSLLFGEQDDDMVEAAAAFLSIFLHRRLPSGLHGVTASACASGCNPHCHFLLLLQSISFDHSILLDFLISAETCFLEYFVRYLKHLGADREGFTLACRRMEAPDLHLQQSDRHLQQSDLHLQQSDRHLQQSLPASHSSGASALASEGELGTRFGSDLVQPSLCVQAFKPPVDGASLASGLRLVDYGSSEESETEDMEVSEDIGKGLTGPGPSVSEEGRLPGLDAVQGTSGLPVSIAQTECKPPTAAQTGPNGLYSPEAHSGQTSRPNITPPSGQTTCETFTRAVLCLSGLRAVVARLQRKNLFPYNPSCLLKLLARVETLNCPQH